MASGKRQPSKQRRAAQNRAQREALAARREAAAQAERSTTAVPPARGSFLSRLRGGGATAGAGASGERPGGLRAAAAAGRAAQPVGYRAGLSALLMALAGVVFAFTFQVAVDADDDPFTTESLVASWASSALDAATAQPDAGPDELAGSIDEWSPGRGSQPLAIALWPYSLSLLLPVIGAGIGFRAIARRSQSKIVSRALFATLFGALLSQIPIFFLPSVVAMGIAVFQIRKYEMSVLAAEQAAVADAGGSSDGVIEADVVDADVVDEEDPGDESAPEEGAVDGGDGAGRPADR